MIKLFIAGLGLIGGSIAKKLKSEHKNEYIIYAYSNNETDIQNAKNEKMIDRGFTQISETDFFDFDVVLLATPPHLICDTAKLLMPHFPENAVFTDVASVKLNIENEMKALNINYVGGHPMAGTEKSGYSESFSHLFENAYYFLTGKNPLVDNLVSDLDAHPVYLDAKTHDKIVAVISHIPHAVSAALVNLAINNETEEGILSKTAAGGFRDTTRISASNENLWEQILFSNKKFVVPLLSDLENLIKDLRNNLINDNNDDILKYFKSARIYRTELEENRHTIGRQYYDIYISVADRVGIISEISKILTDNNISIRNIGILNSREQIGGTLILSVYTQNDYEKSIVLLKDKFTII